MATSGYRLNPSDQASTNINSPSQKRESKELDEVEQTTELYTGAPIKGYLTVIGGIIYLGV
jgi:hypothetical protein